MLMLAVDWNTRETYCGTYGNFRFAQEGGLLFPVKLHVGRSVELSGPDYDNFCSALVFEEMSFEPLSGIRRGYLLRGTSAQGQHMDLVRGQEERRCQVDLFFFITLIAACETGDIPDHVSIAFGTRDRFSIGELVRVERQVDGREILTMRMRRQFGLIPELVAGALTGSDRKKVDGAIEKVVQGYRSSPAESVIDRCREALATILSVHLKVSGKDLGPLVGLYEGEKQEKRDSTSDLAHAVNRLHARGKQSEQSRRNLPPVSEIEAEHSVLSVGIVLVSLGWATW